MARDAAYFLLGKGSLLTFKCGFLKKYGDMAALFKSLTSGCFYVLRNAGREINVFVSSFLKTSKSANSPPA